MSQSSNKILDDFAKLMTDAAGVAQGVRNEVSIVFKTQLERLLADMDLVQREEFEVVRDLATKVREENVKLKEKVGQLEQILVNNGLASKEPESEGTKTKATKKIN